MAGMLMGFEDQSRGDIGWAEKTAQTAIEQGNPETARSLLMYSPSVKYRCWPNSGGM